MEPPPLIDLRDGDGDDSSSSFTNSYTQNLNHLNHGFNYLNQEDTTRTYSPQFFDSSSSSSDNENNGVSSNSVESTTKRLDYMLQFLDRKLSSQSVSYSNHDGDIQDSDYDGSSSSLPEFIGRGGGTGIFRLPVRAAVHPHRPPSLEVRPHPLRETQIGCFFRTVAGSESQLWAGSEYGVRFWNFEDLYAAAEDMVVRGGDEETAPFRESVRTSPTLCLVADEGNRLVWSGHKDGRIRSWRMDIPSLNSNDHFTEALSWQAHRGPVFSLVMTSYGIYMVSCDCQSNMEFASFLLTVLIFFFLVFLSFRRSLVRFRGRGFEGVVMGGYREGSLYDGGRKSHGFFVGGEILC